MNLYSFFAFIRYCFRARTRHAVHAPLAYYFADKVLRSRDPEGLIHRLRRHYPEKPIQVIRGYPGQESIPEQNNPDALLIFPRPYSHPLSYRAWKAWTRKRPGQMSIDLFQMGILIRDPALLHGQHYTLRYFRREPPVLQTLEPEGKGGNTRVQGG